MEDLIEVSFAEEYPTVSARDLYVGLGIKTDFRHWFPRMCSYGFTEGIDYKRLWQKRPTKGGIQTVSEYRISIDMAKHICMMQRDEKGMLYRQYFLELEKAWQSPEKVMARRGVHFQEMSSGEINATELVAALINEKDNLIDGIRFAQEAIEGSMTFLLMNHQGIYCARDRLGRTPLVIGRKETGFCASFESFAYLNIGYRDYKELGPGEVCLMTPEGVHVLAEPGKKMRICTFLWVYYGYPTSAYEGVSVEAMRCRCGQNLAKRDQMTKDDIDNVAGVPDSGTAHAIGYANESGVPFSRPFIKYTPTWPRSFMPTIQSKRDLIAKMKLIPVHELIDGRRLLLIDDSIVRGTQLRETTEFLYQSGAKEVHVRPACPPILFGCKYIGFSRSTSDMELIGRRIIQELEGGEVDRAILDDYANPDSDRYHMMLEKMRERMNFTTLRFNRLDDLIDATGISRDRLCTYCWDGKE